MNAVRRFTKNESGHDYVVGDIHGCFELLQRKLAAAGFDPARDRLFSVGDLVDRGPSSEEATSWLAKPWFHAVRGNHEQMAVDAANEQIDVGLHIINGGGWFHSLSDTEQKAVGALFDDLPLAIEIETPAGLVGMVHAEPHKLTSWGGFTHALEIGNELARLSALWGRERIRAMDERAVDGVALVVVGHTPVKQITRLGNVAYIDTGAVFGHDLTLVRLDVLLT